MERQQRPVQCHAYILPITSLPPVTQPPQSPPKLEASSADLTADLLAALRAQVPHVFTESGIDFDKLKAALGGALAEGKERYGLTWAGKMDAFRNVQSVSHGTLSPMPHESVNWEGTGNLIIEGDNLEVLKLLQRPYHGKVKMIYIDPPYNTGNEFIYPDNFREGLADYLRYSGQISEEGFAQSANKDSNGRYHSNWLNMLYPRLFLARNLLREDGVIFVSIDDHEVHNLRHLMDEVFGEDNFVAEFVRRRRMATGMKDNAISSDHEYVVAFARAVDSLQMSGRSTTESDYSLSDEVGKFRSTDLTIGMTREMRPNQFYSVKNPRTGREFQPSPQRVWRFEPGTMRREIEANNIIWPDDSSDSRMERPRYKTRFRPDKTAPVSTWIDSRRAQEPERTIVTAGLNQEATKELRDLFGDQVMDYPKPVSLVESLAEVSTKNEPDALILDFFAGSGTTAQAVLELNAKDGGNRKFILVQLPEKTENPKFPTIADITRERVRRVIAKLESAAKEKVDAERQSSMALGASAPVANGDADLGFRAFRLAASNFRVWDAGNASDANALAQQIALHADNLNGAASSGALVYELILRAGLPPASRVERVSIAADDAAREAFAVDGDALLVCVENAVTPGLMRAMIARRPKKLVCLDKAFAGDDAAKTNALLEATSHGMLFYTA